MYCWLCGLAGLIWGELVFRRAGCCLAGQQCLDGSLGYSAASPVVPASTSMVTLSEGLWKCVCFRVCHERSCRVQDRYRHWEEVRRECQTSKSIRLVWLRTYVARKSHLVRRCGRRKGDYGPARRRRSSPGAGLAVGHVLDLLGRAALHEILPESEYPALVEVVDLGRTRNHVSPEDFGVESPRSRDVPSWRRTARGTRRSPACTRRPAPVRALARCACRGSQSRRRGRTSTAPAEIGLARRPWQCCCRPA